MIAVGTALSGMQASIARLNASANNIANVNSTGPVPAVSPVAAVTPPAQGEPRVYQTVRAEQAPLAGGGVVSRIVSQTPGYRRVSDPSSPYADARGMIAAPDVDLVDEMVEQLTAKLTYDANLSVLKSAHEMESRIIERWA